jgi:DNA-binding protein H-NS
MRKPRDFDAALKTLTDKTKALKENKRQQLGELIVATGADTLDIETLAGGLLAIVEAGDNAQKEGWHKRGAAFFRKTGQPTSRKSRRNASSTPASDSGETPSAIAARKT